MKRKKNNANVPCLAMGKMKFFKQKKTSKFQILRQRSIPQKKAENTYNKDSARKHENIFKRF